MLAAMRDKDLKGADWFNTTEFPEMTYVGSDFLKKDERTGTVTGKLTLHGVTKARGTLKRSDFGMKTFLGPIGDDVDLIIEIEAKQKS
jgi:polyisoprenoid-binding protein YceI